MPHWCGGKGFSMALALIPIFDLSVTFAVLDEESVIVTRSKSYEIQGADFAEAQTNRDAFLTDLALATGAQITGHRLTERYGDNAAITSTFNLYREMLITFILDGAEGKKAAHAVPAPSLNFVAGQNLNLGHADVTAYINNFLATGGVVAISDGEFVKDANNVAASRIRQVRSGVSYT
jgi:hypothetical protein